MSDQYDQRLLGLYASEIFLPEIVNQQQFTLVSGQEEVTINVPSFDDKTFNAASRGNNIQALY